ncbi:MAG: DUF364 domain-containing protein [Oscillospiraceae bacterium]|jgi:uncharacterized protein (DUF4213/DUF364 family)|nr:DUF364 domain-containing protein [Oscillospiraceae bacterium]
MWTIYDSLIDGIDGSATADDIILGANYSYVRSGNGTGISGAMDDTSRGAMIPRKYIGMPLRELAVCVKSWNFTEASLGLAAINSWYNEKERLGALGISVSEKTKTEDRSNDPFIMMQKDIVGKNVTVVGHFPYIDKLFAPVCNLSVIEKFDPSDGDFPEQAADYLLPESDYVFISSYTLVEKQFPRFLKLSEKAFVTLIGPASPITPVLHGLGVDAVAGLAIRDGEFARNAALGLAGNIHGAGQKVNYLKVRKV